MKQSKYEYASGCIFSQDVGIYDELILVGKYCLWLFSHLEYDKPLTIRYFILKNNVTLHFSLFGQYNKNTTNWVASIYITFLYNYIKLFFWTQLFLIVLEAEKSNIKFLTGPISTEGLLPHRSYPQFVK